MTRFAVHHTAEPAGQAAARYIAGVRHLTSRATVSHLPAVLVPAAVTLLVLYLRLPETAWPAYGSIYLCTVALVAVISGWKDALVALVVGALLLDYFFVGPANSLTLPSADDWAVLLSFVLSSILVAVAIEWRRASEKRLRTGIRLAQAQMDLTEGRALAGFRSTSWKTPLGADDAPRVTGLVNEAAASLERSALAMTRLADFAPTEAADSLRREAQRIVELAREVEASGLRMGDRSEVAGLDEPAYSQ